MPKNSLRIGIVLAAVLLLIGAPTLGGAQETDCASSASSAITQECQSEWQSSAAMLECSHSRVSSAGRSGSTGNKCHISASCLTGVISAVNPSEPQYMSVDIEVCLEDVSDLINCSGNLQVGSC